VVVRRISITLVITLAVVSAPSAARAAAALPRGTRLVVEGRGFGHGRGMGQWGARAMAEAGRLYPAILAHYYRGTSLASRPPGDTIRVLVARRAAAVVSSQGSFAFGWAGGRRIGASDPARPVVRVRVVSGATVVEKARSVSGPWRRIASGRGSIVFSPGRAPLELAGGEVRGYRGRIEARPAPEGRIDVIVALPLEDYLLGVVPREMPSVWHMEALKAQAVAARTYAARAMDAARDRGRPYDICASARCQVFGGSFTRPWLGRPATPLERPRATAAVRATARRVLVWAGRPILAQYSSSTGGYTVAGSFPYLAAVLDPFDAPSPRHRWTTTVVVAAVEARWPALGRLSGVRVLERDGKGEWGGRLLRMQLSGTRRSMVVTGNEFRAALGLRSTWFHVTVGRVANRFTLDMGYGTRHPAVSELQRRLREAGFYPRSAPVTTYFGPITRDSLRAYQRSRGIRATGYLGPITRARLNREAAR
jgi:SpoIID/LytB domain protein